MSKEELIAQIDAAMKTLRKSRENGPMEKPFFAGIPIRMATGMKDAWRLVRIVARG